LAAFPAAASVAEADLAGVGLTTRRAATVRELAGRAAAGDLDLRPGADATEQRRALLGVPGVGAWTAEYVAMRALHDPDAFPASDLVLRRRLAEMGADPRSWRPWRAYAAMHLWLAEPAQPRRARGAQAAAAAPAASSGPSGRTSP
jgi:3-methyladenine DNA glycosylase/8-oxoguanine DNA glycosylase